MRTISSRIAHNSDTQTKMIHNADPDYKSEGDTSEEVGEIPTILDGPDSEVDECRNDNAPKTLKRKTKSQRGEGKRGAAKGI